VTPDGERTTEEREAARREREARRQARGEVEPAPEPPGVPDDGARAGQADAPVDAIDPVDERPASPPATARGWSAQAGAPDADPPPVRRVERGAAPAPPERVDEPVGSVAPSDPPPARIPPPPSFEEGARRRRRRRASAPSAPAPPAPAPAPPAPPRRRGRADAFDEPPERRPPRLERSRRRRRPFGLALAALAAVLVVAVAWFLVALFQPFHGDGGAALRVTIPRGASASEVGALLERRGVIAHRQLFSLRVRLAGKRGDLVAGTFTLRHDMSYGAAIDALTHPPAAAPTIRVTIPEGRSRGEVAPLARAAGLSGDYAALTGHRNPALDPHAYGAPRGEHDLEGFLFPATYEIPRAKASASTLVTQQLHAFRQRIAGVDLRAARRKNLTAYDVLIIASMIEREAAVARDRRLIAAVIYNRLHERMPLGIDATLRFALHDWTRPLTVSQLARDTPYNTRIHTGLPPTPIGSPGLASIEAAADPAHVSYLYYVVKPCGHGAHAFSSTAAGFARDVAAYDRARARAGGKSPVDC
jgi:UPF0755 protein